MSKKTFWNNCNKTNAPLIIAGPCSAETETQVLETAAKIDKNKVSIFRAGVWKPRTRPGGFEGVGAMALPWLSRVKNEFQLPVAIEVAHPTHIELALAHNIDFFWIGARTTANPFSVQEIANALKGVNIPVLVKNPVNADIGLWIGAIERIEKAGIEHISAIHRGVSQFAKTRYRNRPEWDLAFELRKNRPDIFMCCDPSHITGDRNSVFKFAQMALDLKFDGLMIETHPYPDEAWSDMAQQITPETLNNILSKLIVRTENPINNDGLSNIENIRKLLSDVDNEILKLLSERMQLVSTIANHKKQYNMTVFQETRWNEILEKNMKNGIEMGLNPIFITELFKTIHQESIEIQSNLISN
jgi:chorismate mutase